MQTIDTIGKNFLLEDLLWNLTQPEDISLHDEETDDEKPLSDEDWNSIIPQLIQGDYIGFLCTRDGKKDLVAEQIGPDHPENDPVTLKDLVQAVTRGLKKHRNDFDPATTNINEVVELGMQDNEYLWKNFANNSFSVGDMMGDRVFFEGQFIKYGKRFSVLHNKEVNLWIIACGS